jgi:GTP:adenosylcobinamide-phosphate guanylyltransferase
MTDKFQRWTAIVLAGQRPGVDALAAHFGMATKALIPVGGLPMVTRVVRTLNACPSIDRIVVLTQEPALLIEAVAAGGGAHFSVSTAGISASIAAVAGGDSAPFPVLVTTADHPLLTPEIVEAFIGGSADGDLGVGMVERATIHAAYPDNQRTWLKFADGHWSGANLFALRAARVSAALTLWAEAEQDRKKAWKLFLHFGPWLALRALTRTIGLAEAFRQAGQRLGLDARLVALADAEAAIDVDKVSDHALAEQILARRATHPDSE